MGVGFVLLPLSLLLRNGGRFGQLFESRRGVVEFIRAGVDLDPSSLGDYVDHDIVLLLRHLLYPPEEEESP